MNSVVPKARAKLRARRKELGLTLKAVAIEAGVSEGFLSLVETGKRGVSLKTVASVAKTLRIAPAEIFDEVRPEQQQSEGEPAHAEAS